MRALLGFAFLSVACAGAAERSPDGGSGGSGGFNPFGDAGFYDADCDHAEAAPPLDAATGCPTDAGGVEFARDVKPILAGCSGELCHAPPSYDWLVGQPAIGCCDGRLRVVPGNAQRSYLVAKLLGIELCGGVRMPLGDPALAEPKIDIIIRWICEGAPDN